MKPTPKVSIIVPVYNVAPYLRQCMDSLINQTYRNIEIICVNDGATDESGEILDEYVAKGSTIKVISQKNAGLSAARNVGFSFATGDYVMYVDSDDWIDLETCETAVAMAVKHEADIVFWPYIREFQNAQRPKTLFYDDYIVFDEEEFFTQVYETIVGLHGAFLKHPENADTLVTAWGKLYRREFLRKYQVTFTDLSYAEDKLFNMQCYICDAKYVFLEDIGYIYRKNDQSVSWQYRSDSAENWFRMAYELRGWLEQKNKNTEEYASLIRYLILFAAFFDGKMEYMQHRKSLWAVRKVLRKYGSNPIGKKVFTELSDRTRNLQLKQNLWKIMIRTFSTGMKKQWYILMAVGIRMLISHRVDERLSDTGMRG